MSRCCTVSRERPECRVGDSAETGHAPQGSCDAPTACPASSLQNSQPCRSHTDTRGTPIRSGRWWKVCSLS